MSVLGIIPARKGSKGIIHKNTTPLQGKPLIQYTIDAALASGVLDNIVLTTDCPQISGMGEARGIRHIRNRPEPLATDNATMIDTVSDAIEWFGTRSDSKPSVIVLLQPTSPLRAAQDIQASVSMLTEDYDAVISVNTTREHPFDCVELKENGAWSYVAEPDAATSNRQDYRHDFYFINGAVYVVRENYLLSNKKFVADRTRFYEMPRSRSVDIDCAEDLELAEIMLRKHQDAI